MILPEEHAPTNLHLKPGIKQRFVDSDLYDICNRIQEVHPSLYINELSKGDLAVWAIMENCEDGVQRLVYKTDCLDARVLTKVQRMLKIPLEQRFAEAEREEAKLKAEAKERELDELYERVGAPMQRDLVNCGFGGRRESYAKRGVLLGRNRAR